jgi:hypothetical protein
VGPRLFHIRSISVPGGGDGRRPPEAGPRPGDGARPGGGPLPELAMTTGGAGQLSAFFDFLNFFFMVSVILPLPSKEVEISV